MATPFSENLHQEEVLTNIDLLMEYLLTVKNTVRDLPLGFHLPQTQTVLTWAHECSNQSLPLWRGLQQFCIQLNNLTEHETETQPSTQEIPPAQSPGYNASQSLFDESSSESLDHI